MSNEAGEAGEVSTYVLVDTKAAAGSAGGGRRRRSGGLLRRRGRRALRWRRLPIATVSIPASYMLGGGNIRRRRPTRRSWCWRL